MLQEIVRNNDLLKQFKPILPLAADTDESGPENDDDDEENDERNDDELDDDRDNDRGSESDANEDHLGNGEEIPLDLSMKVDSTHHDAEHPSVTITNHKQASSSKHVKTALTPLREQDTLKYRYVNTIELVQTVKDILSRYSISQRHFGEKILGLSQGSVR